MFVGNEGEARLGLLGGVAGEARRKPLRVKLAGHGDGEAVRGLPGLHRLHAFLELEEAFAQRLEPREALLRELQPLAGAAEQHGAEMVLERANLLPHRGRRDRQLVRRASEREMPGGSVINAQGVERQVSSLHWNSRG